MRKVCYQNCSNQRSEGRRWNPFENPVVEAVGRRGSGTADGPTERGDSTHYFDSGEEGEEEKQGRYRHRMRSGEEEEEEMKVRYRHRTRSGEEEGGSPPHLRYGDAISRLNRFVGRNLW